MAAAASALNAQAGELVSAVAVFKLDANATSAAQRSASSYSSDNRRAPITAPFACPAQHPGQARQPGHPQTRRQARSQPSSAQGGNPRSQGPQPGASAQGGGQRRRLGELLSGGGRGGERNLNQNGRNYRATVLPE